MSHSLNNPNKEHFMNRTGSYSTHGSRRGFVDDGIPVFDKTPSGDKFKDFKI